MNLVIPDNATNKDIIELLYGKPEKDKKKIFLYAFKQRVVEFTFRNERREQCRVLNGIKGEKQELRRNTDFSKVVIYLRKNKKNFIKTI